MFFRLLILLFCDVMTNTWVLLTAPDLDIRGARHAYNTTQFLELYSLAWKTELCKPWVVLQIL